MLPRILLACVATILAVAVTAPAATEALAQSQIDQAKPRPVKKQRPQIRVTPLYPHATTSTPYPRPYDVQYPGPNAKRACVAWLAQEARPSGTVIVPRQRCRWVRG